jgi:hypothetical protein
MQMFSHIIRFLNQTNVANVSKPVIFQANAERYNTVRVHRSVVVVGAIDEVSGIDDGLAAGQAVVPNEYVGQAED